MGPFRFWVQWGCLLAGLASAAGAKYWILDRFSLAVVLFVLAVTGVWVAMILQLNALASAWPARARPWIHWIHAQTFEIFTLIGFVFWRTVTLFRKKQAPQAGPGRPILLVHGYLNTSFVWGIHKKRLIKSGFGPIYTIDLGHPFLSIRDYAKKVQEKVHQIVQETNRTDLALVGHSMGGLVSYYYAARLAAPQTVSQVITIASPLQGTHVAKIGLGRCARDMQIDSELINELKQCVPNCSVRFYNIATKTDELIIPYTSSIFMSQPERQYYIEDVGHAFLLVSNRVTQQISTWLKEDLVQK